MISEREFKSDGMTIRVESFSTDRQRSIYLQAFSPHGPVDFLIDMKPEEVKKLRKALKKAMKNAGSDFP